MRELKFQYIWKLGSKLAFGTYNLNEIENGNPTAPRTQKKPWELIAILQFTGLKDKNGVEIYEQSEVDGMIVLYSTLHLRYVLKNISSGDILSLSEYSRAKNGQIKVTKEYSKI